MYVQCAVVSHAFDELLVYTLIWIPASKLIRLWEKEKRFPSVVPPVVRASENLKHFILLGLVRGFTHFARSCSGCNGAFGSIVGVCPGILSYYLTTPCDDSRMEGLAKICTPDHVEETMYFFLP